MDAVLDEIRRRAASVAQGRRWMAAPTSVGHAVIGPQMTWTGFYANAAEADFIAHAPADVQYLLSVIEQQRGMGAK